MAIGDPLRRHDIAERLRRLRADQAANGIQVDPRPEAPLVERAVSEVPADVTITLSQEQLQSMIRQEAARWATVLPLPDAPNEPAWHEEWWHEASGPTNQARAAFGGESSWVFAWVLHERTGLPLVALEVRPVGSRQRVWMLHHVLLDMLDGRLLDVGGAHDRGGLLQGSSTGGREKCRLTAVPSGSDFARYRNQVAGADPTLPGGTPRWQDHMTPETARAADFVATEVLARHGLVGHA